MSAEDVKPTRLGAAQEAIRGFLDQLPDKYRVGLVTFSSRAVRRLAADARPRARRSRRSQFGTAFGRGTAIGDALARSVELLQPVAADGDGSPSTAPPPPRLRRPGRAALGDPAALRRRADARQRSRRSRAPQRAKSYGIPVYTIALGTPDGVINFAAAFSPARAARSRHAPADRARRPAASSSRRRTRRASTRSTRTSPRGSAQSEGVARAELRARSGVAALLALGAGALSLLWVPAPPVRARGAHRGRRARPRPLRAAAATARRRRRHGRRDDRRRRRRRRPRPPATAAAARAPPTSSRGCSPASST